jgi:hypothetical protein
MKEQLASIGITALQVLSPVFIALLGLVAKKLHDLIAARVRNEKLNGILTRLNDTAWTVVTEVEQTIVSKLDPKNPAVGLAAAKAAALANLKTHLGRRGLDELKRILGIADTDLETVLVSYIESKVHAVNQMRPLKALVVPGGAQ